MHILAVDDEKNALRILREAICEAEPSATVYACQEPEEAILHAKENPTDIAFLDICIGPVDGIELGEELKKLNPNINIIFVTSYSEYTMDAIRMHASGYLMKPVIPEDVRKELDNLLNPIKEDETPEGIYAHTFGNFDLFVDGKIVYFSLAKAKEMLAYLIEKEGSAISRKELAAVMFENQEYSRQTQDYLSKIYRALRKSLEEVGADHILIKGRNQYSVDPKAFKSDVRAFFDGDAAAKKAFRGEYMSQYSWGEWTLGEITRTLH